MFKSIILIFLFLFTILAFAADFSAKSQRVKYDFNSDRKLFIGDAKGAEKTEFDDSKRKTILGIIEAEFYAPIKFR